MGHDGRMATYEMGLRTGCWGAQPFMLSFHSAVVVELAPADAPDVLLRILKGAPVVPRELRGADLAELALCAPSGKPVLNLRPGEGRVDRDAHAGSPEGAWELRVEGSDGESLHLYARSGTPFPSEADREALAWIVAPSG
jgi:hypothetical protein